MPRVPTNLPKPPKQVFTLATPVHVLNKLFWEIGYLVKYIEKPEEDHRPASYMAFNVAVTAWHLCDWVWHCCSAEDQQFIMKDLSVGVASNIGNFRSALAKECRELKICQQIANGSKHMKYNNADDKVRVETKWNYQKFLNLDTEETSQKYPYNLIVYDQDKQQDAIEVFRTVSQFWVRKLRHWGFLQDSIID